MRVQTLKEVKERAKAIADDLDMAGSLPSFRNYDVGLALRELADLRRQFIFLGDGTARGFPPLVLPADFSMRA